MVCADMSGTDNTNSSSLQNKTIVIKLIYEIDVQKCLILFVTDVISAYNFSTGFKSGLHGVNFIIFIYFSINHSNMTLKTCLVTPSCWKIISQKSQLKMI